jgi:MoaA/NifB/PqqE/SkfB family radical SAM enzyme
MIPLRSLQPDRRRRLLLESHANREASGFPDTIGILITNRCPLVCAGCSTHEWARLNKRRELPVSAWMEVLEQARDLGADKMMLSGGEPLLRAEDCIALVSHGRRLGLRTALMTSCRGLDAELLTRFYDAGLNELSTSLDGSTQELHDGWRKTAGSFSDVARGLRLVADLRGRARPGRGPFAGVWTTHVMSLIAGHNAGDLVAMHEVAVGLGVELHSYQCLSPDERFERLKVTGDQLGVLERQVGQLADLQERGSPISNPRSWWDRVIPYFAGRMEVPDDRCLAGYTSLILAPDGSASSCRESLSRRAGLGSPIDLEALWRGQELTAARAAMEGCETPCLLRCWVAE